MAINYGTNSDGRIYVKVWYGKLIRDVSDDYVPEPGEVLYKRPHGTKGQVSYLPIASIQGKIEDARRVINDVPMADGKKFTSDALILKIVDGPEPPVFLQLNFQSNEAASLLYRIMSIDVNKDCKFTCSEWNGKSWISIQQPDPANKKYGWSFVPNDFDKDDPNNPVPPGKEVVVNNQKRWDFTDRINYFDGRLALFREQLSNKSESMTGDVYNRAVNNDEGSGDPDLDALLDSAAAEMKAKGDSSHLVGDAGKKRSKM